MKPQSMFTIQLLKINWIRGIFLHIMRNQRFIPCFEEPSDAARTPRLHTFARDWHKRPHDFKKFQIALTAQKKNKLIQIPTSIV